MHFRPQNMLPGLWGWILAAGLGVIFGGCSPLPVASEKTSDDDSTLRINLKMEKHRLANGLTLILVEDHRLPIVAYHTLFRVGSINENRLNNGVSHFLEHMMFKKTKDLQDGEFTQFVEQAGGYFNATTYPDKTQYYERVPREFLPQLMKYEAGRMSALALEEETFNTERQVILEERRLRYENDDAGKLYMPSMVRFLHNSPYYGHSVIGTAQSISHLTRQQMQDYYQLYYAPNNAILTIVGDFDSVEVLALAQQIYGPLAPKEVTPLPPLKSSQRSGAGDFGRHYQYHGESADPTFYLLLPGIDVHDPRVPAWDMVASILAEGASSYLNQRYVYNQRPILRDIALASANLLYDGLVEITGTLMPTTNWPKFQRELARDMPEFCQAVDQPALEKAKNNYRIKFYTALDTNLGMANLLTSYEFALGDYQKYAEYNQQYLNLTLAEVQQACQEIFGHPRFTLASIWKNNQDKTTAVLPPAAKVKPRLAPAKTVRKFKKNSRLAQPQKRKGR